MFTEAEGGGTGEGLRPVARRTILGLSGVAIGSAIMYASAPRAAAAAMSAGVELQPVTDHPVGVRSANPSRVIAFPRQLAIRVLNRTTVLPSGSTFDVMFDPRLYSPLRTAVVTMAGRQITDFTVTASKTDPGTGVTARTVTINVPIPVTEKAEDALVIAFGTARSMTYPYDLVNLPDPVKIQLSKATGGGRLRARRMLSGSPRELSVAGLPWGVELSAFWRKQNWGPEERYSYYSPQQVTVRGVGPAKSPASVVISIKLDPQLVERLEPRFVRLNNEQVSEHVRQVGVIRTGAVYESRWQSFHRLGAGDILEIGFLAVPVAQTGALATIKHPEVSLVSTDLDPRRRVTGKTSISRLDSVWQ